MAAGLTDHVWSIAEWFYTTRCAAQIGHEGILEGEGETRSSDRARRAPLPYSTRCHAAMAPPRMMDWRMTSNYARPDRWIL